MHIRTCCLVVQRGVVRRRPRGKSLIPILVARWALGLQVSLIVVRGLEAQS